MTAKTVKISLIMVLFALVASASAVGNAPYTTYFGGEIHDFIKATVTLDDGSVIVVGRTTSANLPTTAGAFDRVCNVSSECQGVSAAGDAFVAKFAPDGSLAFSTYLGGDDDDGAHDVALAADGSIIVTGFTKSADFPMTAGTFDTTFNSGPGLIADAFAAKLSADGSQLLAATFVGGLLQDEFFGLDLDANGNIYLAGFTDSTNFPTTPGALQTSANTVASPFNAVAVKMSDDLSQLLYSTYLGGDDFDFARRVAVDNAGNAFFVGDTRSLNFPITAGVVDTVNAGINEGFITKLNASGSGIIYSTFIGGEAGDGVSDVVVDNAGRAYITGSTFSDDFLPITPGAFDATQASSRDGFFAILNAAGTALDYNTFISLVQSGAYFGNALDFTDDGTVFIGGNWSETGGFGDRVPYFFQLDPQGNGEDDLLFDCRLCFRFSEGELADIKAIPNGLVVVGATNVDDFAVTANAFDTSFNGENDGFIIVQTNPTTPEVDTFVDVPEMIFAPPDSDVLIPLSIGNLGATNAVNPQVTLTLPNGITYVSDNSGLSPTINGNIITWFPNDLLFGIEVGFEVLVHVPDVNLGTTFSLDFAITADGVEAHPANNAMQTEIVIAQNVYLPTVMR